MVSTVKKTKVKIIAEQLTAAKGIYFADFSRITAKDFTEIRRTLRTSAVKVTVVKNRLALRVLQQLTDNDFSSFLKGQTALALASGDPLTPARIMKGFPKLKVKGAFLEGKIYSQEEFLFLANLPPKEVLAVELVNGIMGPVYSFVSLFDGVMASLIVSLESIRSMKEAK